VKIILFERLKSLLMMKTTR